MRAQFITANEVAEVMGVSRTKAYQIVRAMNKELKEMGYITIAGKCPVQYFKQKFYGLQMGGDKEPFHQRKRKRLLRFHLLAQAGNSRFTKPLTQV